MSSSCAGALPTLVPVPSGRLVLRRWTVEDESALSAAIAASVEHLRPWMAWVADEPLSAAQRLAIIGRWDRSFAAGEEAVYGIFLLDAAGRESGVAGGCGLHHRHTSRPDILEIGYWVHAEHVRRGFATEIAAALTTAAFTVAGVSTVEIHHEKTNVASGAVPARLGFTYTGDTRGGLSVDGNPMVSSTWAMTPDEWATRSSGAGPPPSRQP